MKKIYKSAMISLGVYLLTGNISVSQVAPQAEPVYGGHLEQIDAIPLSGSTTRIFCSTASPNSMFYQDVTGITGTAPTFSGWSPVPDLDENDDFGFIPCFAADELSGFVFAATMNGEFVASGITPGSRYSIGNFIVEGVEAYQGRLFFERRFGTQEWLYICDLDAAGNITSWDSSLIATSPGWSSMFRPEIHVSPFDNYVYFFAPGAPPFIYRSSDPYTTMSNSTTWTALSVSSLNATGKEFLSMGIAPDGRIFTGSYEGNSSGYDARMAFTDTDSDPWTIVPISEDCGRGLISITNNTSGIYYVYFSRVFSDDMGASWMNHGGADGTICVDPTGEQYAYVRTDWGSGCYNNNVGSVTEINNGLLAVQVNDFDIDITKNTAWVASKSGLWYVTNYGSTSPSWSLPIWPMDRTVPWVEVECSSTADTLFCGNNSGDAFRHESAMGPPADPMSYTEIFRASDDAAYPYWNWTYGTYISVLAIDPYAPVERIIIGLNDAEDWAEPDSLGAVFVGDYTGGSWNFIQITGSPIPPTGIDVNDLEVVEEGGNSVIYVGVEWNNTYAVVGSIYRMEEVSPGIWTVTQDLKNSTGTYLSASIKDLWITENDTILACGTDAAGSTVVSYKKAVGGAFWTVLPSSGLLPPNTGRAITYDDASFDTYMAVDNSLYVLQNGATGWLPYYTYPQGTSIQFIYYDDLLVGTGTGLYLHTVSVGAEDPGPATTRSDWVSVYPNPFLLHTTFDIITENSGIIEIRIFDLTGKLVQLMNSSSQGPGHRVIQWNGTGINEALLAEGIYFYRVTFNGKVNSGKLVIQR